MEKQKNKKYQGVVVAICVTIYILLQVCVVIFNSMKQPVVIGDFHIPAQSFCGIFSIMQMAVNVIMVIMADKKGWHAAALTIAINFIWMFIVVGVKRDGTALPSLPILVVNICVVYILYKGLTKIREKELALDKMAHTDSLTSLPNRRAFNLAIQRYIEKGDKFAVAFLDIDNFKNINDTMGHDYGNNVLVEISKRWKSIICDDHFLARLGGDEFSLIVSGYSDSSEVKALVERYQYCLREKFLINGKDFYITASIGVSFFPDHATDSSLLLRYADTAMYRAKSEGKHQICLFSQAQMEMMNADVEGENFVKNAVNAQRFQTVFQPLFDAKTAKLKGFETLIRFKGENDELIQPYEYIRIAEKLNYISYIDNWVMERSMKLMKNAVETNRNILVSVNVSVAFLLSSNFVSIVKSALKSTGFPAANLVVEVTENLFISSIEVATEVLFKLKELGIKIALDDFGTGFASLSYLHSLPIDILKIDKSFVDSLNDDKDDGFITAIISMGHMLDCSIVAEGVETQAQYDKLKKYGCDIIQGFLLGKPTSYENAMEICKQDLLD